MEITYQPIGTIHTPHTERAGMPIQPTGAAGIRGSIEIFPQFTEGLTDLDGFSHVFLLYHFHRSEGCKLTVTPFMDNEPAVCSPPGHQNVPTRSACLWSS